MSERDEARLHRLGISREDLKALDTLWGAPALRPLLNESAVEMQRLGFGPLDALDVIWHRLQHRGASAYLRAGFTPHQAHLLISSDQAQENLYGDPSGAELFNELQTITMPRDLLTELLLAAESPSEARQFIRNTTRAADDPPETPEDRERTVETFATISERSHLRTDACGCEHPPR